MIADYLTAGRENARTGKELAALFGCDLRSITEQIERERRAGRPICATSAGENSGYYLAANADELQSYCEKLHRRAAELVKTHQAMIAGLRRFPGTDQRQQAQEGGLSL